MRNGYSSFETLWLSTFLFTLPIGEVILEGLAVSQTY